MLNLNKEHKRSLGLDWKRIKSDTDLKILNIVKYFPHLRLKCPANLNQTLENIGMILLFACCQDSLWCTLAQAAAGSFGGCLWSGSGMRSWIAGLESCSPLTELLLIGKRMEAITSASSWERARPLHINQYHSLTAKQPPSSEDVMEGVWKSTPKWWHAS